MLVDTNLERIHQNNISPSFLNNLQGVVDEVTNQNMEFVASICA